MENLSKWKLIKAGFWLGIGFIIPSLVVMYSGTALTILAMPSMIEASFEYEDNGLMSDESEYKEIMSNFTSDLDVSDQIKIKSYREQRNGNQLLILGSIENIGDKKASAIQLEAELSDEKGNFVYECSEYINKALNAGEVEKFQIKCGCGDNSVPSYVKVSVRVVSASNY